jgi:hypothetical protein
MSSVNEARELMTQRDILGHEICTPAATMERTGGSLRGIWRMIAVAPIDENVTNSNAVSNNDEAQAYQWGG